MKPEWREDGYGRPMQSLFIGRLYVGGISSMRPHAPTWRGWFAWNDEGDSTGEFGTREEARASVEKALVEALDGVSLVPTDQLVDMYTRFLRLTRMGQAAVGEWLAMPKEIADLRHEIFRQSDFGALFAGQWLPKERRNRARQELECSSAVELPAINGTFAGSSPAAPAK